MKATTLQSIEDPRLPGLLLDGGVGVIPTDTLYGLVCRAADPKAVARLYNFKKRDNKPGTLIAASTGQLVELGLKARYLKAVEQFWPGAISVVVPSEGLDYLHLGKYSLAVRIPAQVPLIQLLQKSGPLLTTSANLPGKPTANTIDQAMAYFGDPSVLRLSESQGGSEKRSEPYMKYGEGVSEVPTRRFAKNTGSVTQNRGVDFYVDGGNLSGHLPSTLIRVIDDAIEVLRPGAVKVDETGRIT